MQIMSRMVIRLSMLVAGYAGLSMLGISSGSATAYAEEIDTSGVIEEVIVTSRRRAESVQDVPLSVTAFGSERIDQIKPRTLRDFDGLAPNVYIGVNAAGPGASALYIRGIGYAGIEKTQSPQVGVIVDGVQLGSSTGQLIDAFDIESIEVNRGPQGVLFGRNTTGGNIVVNRVKPQFNDFAFKASAEVGNFNTRIYKARVNIPLIDDTLAVKVGATTRQREGWYDNATLGGNQGEVDYAAQTVSFLWTPNDRVDVQLTYDRIEDDSEIIPQDPRFDGSNPFVNRADKREPVQFDVDQVALKVDWDINDRVTLHSITGYHDSRDQVNQDFDGGSLSGTAIPFAQLHTLRTQEFDVFSQEFRVDVDINENVDIVAGIYYFDAELDFNQLTNNVLQIPFGLPAGVPCSAAVPGLRENPEVGNALCQFPNARSEQIAAEDSDGLSFFGAVNFRPFENWEFSLGFRSIDDEKDATNSYFDFSDGTFDTLGPAQEFNFTGRPRTAGVAYGVADDWSDTLILASARWDLSETSSIYASYSEGFRSGGISIRSARAPEEATFDPEEAYQIEIGMKNEFFDRALTLNAAIFVTEIEGEQRTDIITLPPGSIPGTTTIINNEDTTDIEGIELEAVWRVNDNWTLALNGGYIDLETEEFELPCLVIDTCDGVPTDTLRQLGGDDLGRAPEWNASLNIIYSKELGNGHHVGFNVSGRKVGDFLLTSTGGVGELIGGDYSVVDARIQYDWPVSEDGVASIALFGKNLADEEYREQALFLGNGAPLADGGPATGFQSWGPPRSWGLELTIDLP